MNYELETDEGLNNAARWTQATLDTIKTGGKWVIPRSGTIITIDHENKTAYILAGFIPEPATEKVIKHMGWEVKHL
jgi:hypothetical protein